MTHDMVMILSGLLKHVRGGLDLKRFDHILITVGGGTGTKKIGSHTGSVKNHLRLLVISVARFAEIYKTQNHR